MSNDNDEIKLKQMAEKHLEDIKKAIQEKKTAWYENNLSTVKKEGVKILNDMNKLGMALDSSIYELKFDEVHTALDEEKSRREKRNDFKLGQEIINELDTLAKNSNSRGTKELLETLKKKIVATQTDYMKEGDPVKAINGFNLALNEARVRVHYDWLHKKSSLENSLINIDKKIKESGTYIDDISSDDKKLIEEFQKNDFKAKLNAEKSHTNTAKKIAKKVGDKIKTPFKR